MKARKLSYKPLLFTTTMRNPQRIKLILNILKKYDNQVLSNDLAKNIVGDLIKFGLYRPNKVSNVVISKWGSKRISSFSEIGNKLLTDAEVNEILVNNPQNHKESGFDKGWPSRFATIFDLMKEFGFVYYNVGEKIKFSEIGNVLIKAIKIDVDDDYVVVSVEHPENEQQAFLLALTKYQRNNPFVKVLNNNAPLILLLSIIKKINSELKGTGISKMELPLLIFWKDNNVDELFNLIKQLRKKYGLNPSWEVIDDICINYIMKGDFKKFKIKSIISEYPDEYIRKMRLTGLISIRGGGRFIDINNNEIEKINYILKNYSKYPSFESEKEYFKYVSTIDAKLVSITTKKSNIEATNKMLDKWIGIYSWDNIKYELLVLSKKGESKDGLLRLLSHPVRLEFLITLAIKSKFNNIQIVPNYPCDDEGIPTSTASGNKGDIECYEDKNGILIEVTMSEGRTQTMMEIWPIARHLDEFNKRTENSICYFIAPTIFVDSKKQIGYVKAEDNLIIYPRTICEFIDNLGNNKKLYISQ